MNVFQLLVAAVAAVILLYFGSILFAPFLEPTSNLSTEAQALLVSAQVKMGEGFSTTIQAKAQQNLYARNLDSPGSTMAFACSGISCCESAVNCALPITANAERIIFNQSIQTTLTARCELGEGINLCKIYVGKKPAQLAWSQTAIPPAHDLDAQPGYEVRGMLKNTGEVKAENVNVTLGFWETQTFAGEEDFVLVHEVQTSVGELSPGQEVEVVVNTAAPAGEYEARLIAQGPDAGLAYVIQKIVLTGTASLCAPLTQNLEVGTFDAFENVCRAKRYCEGCSFAFECREAWEQAMPLSGGASYDPDRGEPTFAYALYPPIGASQSC